MHMAARANAKINLTLDITGVRDDGYHLLEMIMQSVSLYDTVEVTTDSSGEISVVSSLIGLGGKNDIAYKAASAFTEVTGIRDGIKVKIEKRIPCAAGLGGGSADAAAVLMILNKMYGYPISNTKLEKLALKLGADVPYFLYGGTVLVSGIGDVFSYLPPIPNCYIVIAKNAVKKSTGDMYRIIDHADNLPKPDNKAAINAIKDGNLNLLCKHINNVFSVAWNSPEITKTMKSSGAIAVSISGSGPSYFGVFNNDTMARDCVDNLKKLNIEAYFASPVEKSVIFE